MRERKLELVMTLATIMFMALFSVSLLVINWEALGIVGRALIGIGTGVAISLVGVVKYRKEKSITNQIIISAGTSIIQAVLIVLSVIGYNCVIMMSLVGTIIIVAVSIKMESSIIMVANTVSGYIAICAYTNTYGTEKQYITVALVLFIIANILTDIAMVRLDNKYIFGINSILGNLLFIIIGAKLLEIDSIYNKVSTCLVFEIISVLMIVPRVLRDERANKGTSGAFSIIEVINVIINLAVVSAVTYNMEALEIENIAMMRLCYILVITLCNIVGFYVKRDRHSLVVIAITVLFYGVGSLSRFSIATVLSSLAIRYLGDTDKSSQKSKDKLLLLSSVVASICMILANSEFRADNTVENYICIIADILCTIICLANTFEISRNSIAVNHLVWATSNCAVVASIFISGVTVAEVISKFVWRWDEILDWHNSSIELEFILDMVVLEICMIVIMMIYQTRLKGEKVSIAKSTKVLSVITNVVIYLTNTVIAPFILCIGTLFNRDYRNIVARVILSVLAIILVKKQYNVLSMHVENRRSKLALQIITGIDFAMVLNTQIMNTGLNDTPTKRLICAITIMLIAVMTLVNLYKVVIHENRISGSIIFGFALLIISSMVWLISASENFIPVGMLLLGIGTFICGYIIRNREKIYSRSRKSKIG